MRINKYLSHKGYATRREADRLIERGAVYINGSPATLGANVTPEDIVEVRGRKPVNSYRTLLYYKPRGIVTNAPQKGEKSIADVVKGIATREQMRPVGRLDKESEGLILLTNDPRIIEPLLSPALAHEKEYRVTIAETFRRDIEALLAKGVKLSDYTTRPAKAVVHDAHTATITLTEGKHRQIRRTLAALGYSVKRLVRVRIMHLTSGTLKPNTYRPLSKEELEELYRALGIER